MAWLLNKSWITNLKLDASVYYNDNKSHAHTPYSYASEQPAVHAEQEGYFIAGKLPYHSLPIRLSIPKNWIMPLR